MIIPGLIISNACSQALSRTQSRITSTYCVLLSLTHMRKSVKCQRVLMLYERTLWVIFFNSILINAFYYKCILNCTINYTVRGLKIDECFSRINKKIAGLESVTTVSEIHLLTLI